MSVQSIPVGGEERKDEDVKMLKDLDGESHSGWATRRNSSSIAPPTRISFASVMVDLCMEKVMELTSAEDRIRSISVSKQFLRSVQRPTLWSNYVWDCSYPELPTPTYPVHWLQSSIGEANHNTFQLSHLVADCTRFIRLQHMELDLGGRPSRNASIGSIRQALQTLKLKSLTVGFTDPNNIDVLSAILGDRDDVIDPNDSTTHPAIWSWCETLESLSLPHNFISTRAKSLTERVWPRLIQLDLDLSRFVPYGWDHTDSEVGKGFIDLDKFLTVQSIPHLQDIKFRFSHDDESYPECSLLHSAVYRLIQDSTELHSIDIDFVLWNQTADISMSNVSNPQLTLPNSFIWPESICKMILYDCRDIPTIVNSSITELDLSHMVRGRIHLPPTELFSLLAAPNVPHLSKLKLSVLPDDSVSGLTSDKRLTKETELISYMSKMYALTCLDLRMRYDANVESEYLYWINLLHHLPSITTVDVSTWEHMNTQGRRLHSAFTISLGHLKLLRSLKLDVYSTTEILLVLESITGKKAPKPINPVERLANRHLVAPRPCPQIASSEPQIISIIESIDLKMLLDTDSASDDTRIPRSILWQLTHLPNLTSLRLSIWQSEENELHTRITRQNEQGETIEFHHSSYLMDLIQLKQLKYLYLEDELHTVDDVILQHWSEPPHFQHLCTITLDMHVPVVEEDEDDDTEPSEHEGLLSVKDGYRHLLRLPQLYHLHVHPWSSTEMLRLRRLEREANDSGRTPTIRITHQRSDSPRDIERLRLSAARLPTF